MSDEQGKQAFFQEDLATYVEWFLDFGIKGCIGHIQQCKCSIMEVKLLEGGYRDVYSRRLAVNLIKKN